MKSTLPLPADFSLKATVLSHGFFETAPFFWDETAKVLHRVERIGRRACRVEIKQQRRTLWVNVIGARVSQRMLERVKRALQIDKELAPFYQAIASDAHLAWIPRGKYGRVLRGFSLFEDVTKAICATNIQWAQAVKMIEKISKLGLAAPRGGRAFPTPEEVLKAGAGWLRNEARTGYRADSIIQLAASILTGEVSNDQLHQIANGEELRKELEQIRGIGPASARYLAAFFGKHDAVTVDSAVVAFAKKRHFKRTPKPKQVERFYQRYGEWAGLVSWFEVWQDYRERNNIPY